MTETAAGGGAPGDKKRVPFQILEILRQGNGDEREFSQSRLRDLLAERYGADVHRDTVSAALNLAKGYFPEVRRRQRGPYALWSWRDPEPEPLFDASQARYLADSVVAARRLTPANKAELVDLVLANADGERMPWDDVLSSTSMASRESSAVNPEFFLSVEVLAECVQNGWLAAFRQGEIDRSGRFAKALPDEGEVGPVVPRFLIVSEGVYYLACRFPGHEKVYHYRVDLMHGVRAVPDGGSGAGPGPLNAERYRAQHPLMFSGAGAATVRIEDTPAARLHFFDRFGGGARLISQEDGYLTYEVRADGRAAAILACQFAGEMEVLAPQSVRDEVAAMARSLARTYRQPAGGSAADPR